jgi:glycosyltransferase involved in cell wall biosynthesis
MKICFFSKYPPIEGGVSSRTYWLAKGLGEAGHEVHIVTNALEVEEEYREKLDFENPDDLEKYQPKNVFVHSLEWNAPSHIPYSQEYLARLINLGVKVIRDYDCDVIDSYYFLPYGLAAMFAKMLTGKPLIIRHAGSDITRIFRNENFHQIILELFKNADLMVASKNLFKTNPNIRNEIEKNKIAVGNFFGFSREEFSPEVEKADLKKEFGLEITAEIPVITYIGKYGKNKGVDELLEALSEIKDNFFLLLISGGRERGLLEKKIRSFPSLNEKYCITGFVAPWKIPSIIKRSSLTVQLENNFPIDIHMPIQPLESFSVGTPVILSLEIFNKYDKIFNLVNGKSVLAVDPSDIKMLREKIELFLRNSSLRDSLGKEALNLVEINDFRKSINNNIELYKFVTSKHFRFELVYKETCRSFRNFFEGGLKKR